MWLNLPRRVNTHFYLETKVKIISNFDCSPDEYKKNPKTKEKQVQ